MVDIANFENQQSMDLNADARNKLGQMFPEAIDSEGNVDFNILKLLVTGDSDYSSVSERFGLNWNGKFEAIKQAQKMTNKTVIPVIDESKDWYNTKNVYIEGDNLDALKIIQRAYASSVKMIYLDPPYNTGRDFIYRDDFFDDSANYLKESGQIDNEGRRYSTNSESSGRFHTDWLNMMYPRIKLGWNLLKDDGVMFISIGEQEVINLKEMTDEIFGENNFITLITRVQKRGGNKGNFFNPASDYILVYAKNITQLDNFIEVDIDEKIYNKIETEGPKTGEKYAEVVIYMPNLDYRPNQRFYVDAPDGSRIIPPEGKSFRWSKERFDEEMALGNVAIKPAKDSKLIDQDGNQSKWIIYQKRFLKDTLAKGTARPNNLFEKYQNMQSSKEMAKLGLDFDYAKPVELIKYLLRISKVDDEDIVLDYFSGSGTTAQAVMEVNLEDNKNIRYILVQLKEDIDEKSPLYKEGITNIPKLAVERIKRSGNQIDSQIGFTDTGFKKFKVARTNIKSWSDTTIQPQISLSFNSSNLVDGRTDLDLLYEIIVKKGLSLTLDIVEIKVSGGKVFDVQDGTLYVVTGNDIKRDVANAIITSRCGHEENDMLVTSNVVFVDEAFKSAEEKLNAIAFLRNHGYDAAEIESI
ncbi:site-specific DNA-methyltransferase [Leuconostoc mesenteroides]|uniref:site-specific DNA-methyltransferase n=1 Tax=Leuconostoc mesenteroides TaxID=1245 RepID=UPI002361807E|nr:site-specific DNA-methyltransferase [Leuconostoc mesenteroides]